MKASRFNLVFCLLFSYLSQPVFALKWDLTPDVEFSETYNDNIRLDPSNEQEDFVTQVNPTLTLLGDGKYLNINGYYKMQTLFYQETAVQENPKTLQQFGLDSSAEILRDVFFFDLKASRNQKNIDVGQAVSFNNVTQTENRTDVDTWRLGPRFQYITPRSMRFNAAYQYENVNFIDRAFATQTEVLTSSIISGKLFSHYDFDLGYRRTQQDFQKQDRPDVLQSAYLTNRWFHTIYFATFLQTGYEDNNFSSISEFTEPDGPYWMAGFQWKPRVGTHFEIGAGERFFGPQYRLKLLHHTRNTVWNLTYEIENSSYTQEIYGTPLTQTPETAPAIVLIKEDLGAINQRFIRESMRGSFTFKANRNVFALSGFGENREFDPINAFGQIVPARQNKHYGGSFSWLHRMGPRTSFKVLYFSQISMRDTNDTNLDRAALNFKRQIRPNVSFELQYSYTEQKTEATNVSQGDIEYRENLFSLQFSMQF